MAPIDNDDHLPELNEPTIENDRIAGLPTLAPAPIMPSMPADGTAPIEPAEAPAAAPITDHEVGEYREQDRYLPVRCWPLVSYGFALTMCYLRRQIANVSRIMKQSVPHQAKISKEAKECVQECVSEFIAFVTAEAADRCGAEKRKTVGGEDILHALSALGFDNYTEALKIYLARLRLVRISLFPDVSRSLTLQQQQQNSEARLRGEAQADASAPSP
jgi:nuclear transcription Y subunit beta